MGIVCCKQDLPQDHSVLSHYHSKPSAGGFLCQEIKTQFQLCPTRKRQKIRQRRRFRKRCLRKERPIISSPKLLNPKYLTGEKWHNVILTIPDPQMKTRTPMPPPRKKRRSLINLSRKPNGSVEYVNLCSCQNEISCDQYIFDPRNLLESRAYSSEPELFKKFNENIPQNKQEHSNLRKFVSYEDVTSRRAFCHVIKTSDNTNVLHSYINRCLLCYINEIMSRLEQLNRTNNDVYKFKLNDTSTCDYDEYSKKEIQMYETKEGKEEEQDGRTVLDKETKLSEINEQKLLESFENFCIHCYLNKIQTHPEEREDISSTSRKVKENNLKSSRTGDNNNFPLANKNGGNKVSLVGDSHDMENSRENFTGRATVTEKERVCASSMRTESLFLPRQNSLDKKYECLFCCINKEKTKEKHYNSGSLHEIYSKKQKYNVFKSDNINEQECKYTIGNKIGDKMKNKIRNEKLCEINNAQNKSMHTHSNNMLEHFKNLNSCRKRHLNLFKFMCFQCFYVYIQILYVLQSSALFIEDFTSSLFKMRKCEMMRNLSIREIRTIVVMVQEIHYCYNDGKKESNICKNCSQMLHPDDGEKVVDQAEEATLSEGKAENVENTSNSKIHFKNITPKGSQFNDSIQKDFVSTSDNVNNQKSMYSNIANSNDLRIMNNTVRDDPCEIDELGIIGNKIYDRKDNTRQGFILNKKKYTNSDNIINNNSSKLNDTENKLKFKVQKTKVIKNTSIKQSLKETKDTLNTDKSIHVGTENQTTKKIMQNFEKTKDPSAAERRKDKFQKLIADLHSKKIQNQPQHQIESQMTVSKSLVDSSESEIKKSPHHEVQKIFDDNGNYLDTNDNLEHKSSELSNGNGEQNDRLKESSIHSSNKLDLTDSVLAQINENSPKFFIKRNSMKRKSYRVKCATDNNLQNDLLQVPGDFESRRSSVTDSLYELEASLYEMLQNSCSLSIEDVEYV